MSTMSSASATNAPSASSNRAAHLYFSESESHVNEATELPTKGPDAEPTGDAAAIEPSPTVHARGADQGWGGGTTSTQVSTNLPTVSVAVEDTRRPPPSHTEGPPTSHQCGSIMPRETITSTPTAAIQEPSASRRTTTGEGPPQLVISKPVLSPEGGYRESVTEIPSNAYATPDVTTRDFAPTSDSSPVTRAGSAPQLNTVQGSPVSSPVTSGGATIQDVPSQSASIGPVQTPDLADIDRVARGPESIDIVFNSAVSSSGESLPTLSSGITHASPLSEPSSTLQQVETSISESSAGPAATVRRDNTPPKGWTPKPGTGKPDIKKRPAYGEPLATVSSRDGSSTSILSEPSAPSATVRRDNTPPKGWTPKPGPGKPDIKKRPAENQPLATVNPSVIVPDQLTTSTTDKPSSCEKSTSSTPNSSPVTSNVTSDYKPVDPISVKAATAATTSPAADEVPFVPSSAEASTTSSAVATSIIPTPVTDPVTEAAYTNTSGEIVVSLPTTCNKPTGNVTGGANSSTSPVTAVDAPTSVADAHTPSASSYYVKQGGNEHPPKPTVMPSPASVTEVPSPLPSSYYIDQGGNEHPPKGTTLISPSNVTVTGVAKLTVTYTGNLTTTAAPIVSDATTVMTITYIDTYDKYESASATVPPVNESAAERTASPTVVSGSNTKTFTIHRSVDAPPSPTVGDATSSAPPQGSVTALSSTATSDATTILPSLLPGHSTSTSCIRSLTSVAATAIGYGNTTSSSVSTVYGAPEIPTSISPYTWHDPKPFGTATLSTSTNTDNNPYTFPTVGPVAVLPVSRMDVGVDFGAAEPTVLGAGLGEYERAYGAGVGNTHTNTPRAELRQGFGISILRIGAHTALWGVLLSSLLSKGGKRYAKEVLATLVAIALVVVQMTPVHAAEFPADDMAYAYAAVEGCLGDEGALFGGLTGFALVLLVIGAGGSYYIKKGVAKTRLEAGVESEAVEWAKFYAAKDKGKERRKE